MSYPLQKYRWSLLPQWKPLSFLQPSFMDRAPLQPRSQDEASSVHRMDVDNAPQETVDLGRSTEAKREEPARQRASKAPQMERAENEVQQTDKLSQSRPYQSSATGHRDSQRHAPSTSTSRTRIPAYNEYSKTEPERCDTNGPSSLASLEPRKSERIDSPQLDPAVYHAALSKNAELCKRHDVLSRKYKDTRHELWEKSRLLEGREQDIRSLRTDIADLQRRYEEKSAALASVRRDYKSCQSQLDNVQRFISTADAHADLDIIQKLHELNEEVYQTSMAMADYLTEDFTRSSTKDRQMTIQQNIFGTIGKVMLDRLAAVGDDEDIALFLQIAFQCYLSHFLCFVVSSWTTDSGLNAFIEETYQRIRKAETQAISGRWRSLARSHILLTPANDSKFMVEQVITGLSDITMVARFAPSRQDAESKLASKFGEKIGTIVSHAGTFGNMLSGMISGDFEVFAVQPGVPFDKANMVDMNEDEAAPHATGTAQTVLCASRVGLRKLTGEKTLTLTKAQVVLESFLG